MAVGGIAAIAVPVLQYGLPAALELSKLVTEWIQELHDNPKMTQEEYDAKYAAMQSRYRAATDKHAALRAAGH